MLNEAKQVGILYHFTGVPLLEKMLKDFSIKINKIGIEERGLSLTRNYRLPETNSEFGWTNVRLVLDGDKISDTYKISPYLDELTGEDMTPQKIDSLMDLGYSQETILSTSIGYRHLGEYEERIPPQENKKLRKLDLSKYLLSVDFLVPYGHKGNDHRNKMIEQCKSVLSAKGIPYTVVRSWRPYKRNMSTTKYTETNKEGIVMNDAILKLKPAILASINKDVSSKMKESKIVENSKKIDLDSAKKKNTELLKEKLALQKENNVLSNKAKLLEFFMDSDFSENQKNRIYESLKTKFASDNFEQLMKSASEGLKEGFASVSSRKPLREKGVGAVMSEGSDMTSLFNNLSEMFKDNI